MIDGHCHCGRVGWTLHTEPEPDWLTRCNCSYCRRSGALWAYAPADAVTLNYEPEDTIRYIRGDATLAFIACARCGGTTHWESLDPANRPRMAVNMLMAEPDAAEGRRIRLFDGADTWEFLD